MAKATAEQGKPYFYDEGEYLAILREVEEKHVDFTYKSHHKAVQNGKARVGDQGGFDQWIWKWELLEGEQAGRTMDVTTEPKVELTGWSPAKSAYEALVGSPIELGQEIDTDLVVGLKARLVLTHLDPRTQGDRTYYETKVTDVLPARDGDEGIDSMYSDEPPF